MLDLFVARFPAYPSAPICSNDFPKKPRGMHRMTYYRLLAKAMKAQDPARPLFKSAICFTADLRDSANE